MLFLARRAGRVVGGDRAVRAAIQRGCAKLVLLATNASGRTRRTFLFWSRSRGVPVVTWGLKEELGRIMNRATCAVMAITDENFSQGILKHLERGDSG
ncbi:50S ribosomal protein L7 [Desulfofundulus sp. TPOSR]|jgi:ribosomal protein L7Ae-like RNA K-turn-binding protein|uniref:L7Ae/L30e/S12e/Gadd45 family ribosomal protein n=1 Tax=Desulfofundulus sp. TPOSR TaxID=2714340 RepID=UPI00140A7EFB|nr:L7Ae/L30e/S12e/Gadd45 family ribosomal protein [Desulfofundulus sp. TPOSR]NHM27431.1 50S ribosomal protein L7 [Desulfofundulus sp. TPOSR]